MIALITSIYCADILRIMRTPENIFEGAYAYLLVTFIEYPVRFCTSISIIRALEIVKTPFWFLLFSTILNIILDLSTCILVLKWEFWERRSLLFFSQEFCLIVLAMYRHFRY